MYDSCFIHHGKPKKPVLLLSILGEKEEEARGDLNFACGKTEGRFILNFRIARVDLVNVLQRKISD